jgi:hypothetical protein
MNALEWLEVVALSKGRGILFGSLMLKAHNMERLLVVILRRD